jgi:hypothetical protein
MKKNELRLYNLIFPLWFIVWIPGPWWILLIPANYFLDRFVLKRCLDKKLTDSKPLVKKYSWRVCLFGFLSDFIGALFMLGVFEGIALIGQNMIDSGNKETGLKIARWAGSGMINVWQDPLAFIIALVSVVISALMIYLFNKRMLRKNTEIGEENARYCAKRLAIATAPYLYLIPVYFGG